MSGWSLDKLGFPPIKGEAGSCQTSYECRTPCGLVSKQYFVPTLPQRGDRNLVSGELWRS